MTISEENSKAVNVLKYILAILVVFIHIPAETRNDPVYNGFVANITRTAVPFFFAISGFFAANKQYGTLLKSRFFSLVATMVIWDIVCFALIFPLTCQKPELSKTAFYIRWILGFSTTPTDMPLWYLRNLFVMVAISPVISLLAVRFRNALKCLILLGIPAFVFADTAAMTLHVSPCYYNMAVQSAVFFSAGMYAALNEVRIETEGKFLRAATACFCMTYAGYFLAENETIKSAFSQTSALLFAVPAFRLAKSIGRKMPAGRAKYLAKLSLFIFVSHYIFACAYSKWIEPHCAGFEGSAVSVAYIACVVALLSYAYGLIPDKCKRILRI